MRSEFQRYQTIYFRRLQKSIYLLPICFTSIYVEMPCKITRVNLFYIVFVVNFIHSFSHNIFVVYIQQNFLTNKYQKLEGRFFYYYFSPDLSILSLSKQEALWAFRVLWKLSWSINLFSLVSLLLLFCNNYIFIFLYPSCFTLWQN